MRPGRPRKYHDDITLEDRLVSRVRRGMSCEPRTSCHPSGAADPAEGFTIRIEFAPADAEKFEADEVALFGNHVDIVDGEHRLFVVIAGRLDEDGSILLANRRLGSGPTA